MSIPFLRTTVVACFLIAGLIAPSLTLAVGAGASPGTASVLMQSDLGGTSSLMVKKGKSGKGDHGKKDKPDKEKKDKPDKGKGKKQKVAPIAANSVSVSCTSDSAAGTSTCAFTATGPNGPAKVKVLYVPEAVACSAVVETTGSGATVDGAPAFASGKNHPELTIVVRGIVSVGGTATYWVEAGKQLVPVAGPGLRCATPTAIPPTPTATPERSVTQSPPTTPVPVTATSTASPVAETGVIEIRALACSGEMSGSEPDWFRSCPDSASGLQFRLAPLGSNAGGLTSITDATGKVSFDNLQPGIYRLNLVDVDWCHAESNSVDANGNLVVDKETPVTVWIFTCN